MEDMWKQWKESPSEELKKKLMLNYTNLVHYVLHNSKFIKDSVLDDNDFFEFGMEGLSEAIDRFDPDYGTKFETYAILRIRGSMIDALRKNTKPAEMKYAKNVDADNDYLPSDLNLEEETENDDIKDLLIHVIQDLDERDRLVLTLYYYENLTYKEISEILCISVPRVSQIHTQIIEQLRLKLNEKNK